MACQGVTINGSASYGKDPVPLFEAGSPNMACVLEIDALGQIQVSTAVLTAQFSGGQASFANLQLLESVTKYSVTASSGQAYFVSTLTTIGRSN